MRKANYLLLSLFFMLMSCSNELSEGYNDTHESIPCLEFDTSKEFLDTFDYLSEINEIELIQWIEVNNKTSTLSSSINNQDELIKNTPRAFQALFNKKLEVKINNSIVQYCNGDLFIITYQNGQVLKKEYYGSAKYDDIQSANINTRNHSGSLKPNDKQSSRQHGFSISANDYQYKYVHQMRSFTIRMGSYIRCVLTLDVKMEYKKSGSWKPAGRARTVELNLTGWHSWKGNRKEFTAKTAKPDYWTEGNITYNLATIDVTSVYSGDTVWNFDFSGTITQEVVGYPDSRWTDTF